MIDNTQPANYHRVGGFDDEIVTGCANIHGGRDCSTFRGVACGDHMATSTLNGALESEVNAGDAVGDSYCRDDSRLYRVGAGGRLGA